MVIFDEKEEFEFNKKEQKRLEEMEVHLKKIIELNSIKEPYGHIRRLIDVEFLQDFIVHFYDALNSKVLEIYKKEKELGGLPKEIK